jgi:hypothetical protein
MGHVFVRLNGYGLRLVPYWPYRFARVVGGVAVEVTRWTADGPRVAVIHPDAARPVAEVVDVGEASGDGNWVIETSVFTVGWPDGFAIESSQDPTDRTAFYLVGPDEAMIFPQGPVRAERLANVEALVAAGQRVHDRRRVGGIDVVELAYDHEDRPWWQGHWMVPHGEQRVLLVTAQAPWVHGAAVRTAAEAVATSMCA